MESDAAPPRCAALYDSTREKAAGEKFCSLRRDPAPTSRYTVTIANRPSALTSRSHVSFRIRPWLCRRTGSRNNSLFFSRLPGLNYLRAERVPRHGRTLIQTKRVRFPRFGALLWRIRQYLNWEFSAYFELINPAYRNNLFNRCISFLKYFLRILLFLCNKDSRRGMYKLKICKLTITDWES